MNYGRVRSFNRSYSLLLQSFPDNEENQKFRLERRIIDQLEDALECLPKTLKEIADIGAWNFPELKRTKEPTRLDDSRWYRKPKIVLNVDITRRGNLALSWMPAPGYERDTVYGAYYDTKTAFERPRNELLLIRDFTVASSTVQGGVYGGPYDRDRLCAIVDLVRSLIEHVGDLLSVSCDVEIDQKLHVDFDDHGAVSVHVETDVDRKARLSYVPDAIDLLDPDDEQAFISRYGITAETLVGFVKATRRYRMPLEVMAQILHDRHGMSQQAWDDGFEKLIKKIEMHVSLRGIFKKHDLPMKGTPLAEIKAIFSSSYPSTKSWHVGSFCPVFSQPKNNEAIS